MKKIFIVLFLIASSCLIAVDPFFPGGQVATPSVYKVTFSKIEFGDTSGNYVTMAEGTVVMDIASVNPFEAVGKIGEGKPLPPATYNRMRFTVSKVFSVTASTTGTVTACTTTGNPSSTMPGYETMGDVANATEGSTSATEQSIDVPVDPDHMPSGETLVGNNIVGIKTIPTFTVPEEGKVVIPFKMNFDVTDSVEFVKISGTVYVFNHPPIVTFTSF